jgi:hypothetical protein
MKRLCGLLLVLILLLPLTAQAKVFLADTNDTLEVVTASGVSTINVQAAWADITTTAITPGSTNSLITTATTTTVVASPGASTYRQIKGLTIYNSHASSSNAISVQQFDGTNRAVMLKYTLLAGETIQWNEDAGFRVIDASGQVKGAVVADTELPTGAALADNTANPTIPGVAAFLMCYDGSTWDRCQGGLSDTDDGTIATAQVPSMVIPLNYVFDGTNWVRESRGTAGTAAAQVLTIQGIASMTPVQVQSNSANLATQTTAAAIQTSVELIDNAVSGTGFNISQINGVTPLMGAGNTGTGSPRVTISTDQAALVGLGIYTEDAGETAGGNLSMAGSVRRDSPASSAGTTGDNATINTDQLGRLYTRDANPCSDYSRITHAVISESTAATNEIVALNGSDLIYVCSYKWVTTAANSLNWTRGTGTDCATGTTAIEGAQPFAANGGVAESGGGHPLFVVPAGNALCLVSSAATAHGGRVSYVRTAAP